MDEGWFSDHVNTGNQRDDFSEVDDEFKDDPPFLSDRSRNTNEIIDSDSVFDDEQDGTEDEVVDLISRSKATSASQTSTSVISKKSLKTVLSDPRQ